MTINPITRLDYPDPDVIRVEDTYYLISTTMHFFPGGEILSSRDLVNWEHCAYVYDALDHTPGQRLEEEEHIYGKGMWAACIRYHQGRFYVVFVANDTHQSYLYTAQDIHGPWQRKPMEGFYHDCSLLFNDDGRVYIAYGGRDIYITELKDDLSGPREGGLHRLAVSDRENPQLGYEGSHFYKIKGKYYLFFIHSRRDRWRRVEACFMADSLEGDFVGGDILDDDLGYCDQGAAQGGIVDTKDGNWYGLIFQDRGAVGRIPILVPMQWQGDRPVFGVQGRIPEHFPVPQPVPCRKLTQSDDFTTTGNAQTHGSFGLKSCWQFNHEPDLSLTEWNRAQGLWTIRTDKLCRNVTQARNTLTQRMCFPHCAGEITVDAENMKVGDVAGLCALQGFYGLIGIEREEAGYFLTMRTRPANTASLEVDRNPTKETEWQKIPWPGKRVQFRVEVDFEGMRDEAMFFYRLNDGEAWQQLGIKHKLYFNMEHFVGCRFGLYLYATRETGGSAAFSRFVYEE